MDGTLAAPTARPGKVTSYDKWETPLECGDGSGGQGDAEEQSSLGIFVTNSFYWRLIFKFFSVGDRAEKARQEGCWVTYADTVGAKCWGGSGRLSRRRLSAQ